MTAGLEQACRDGLIAIGRGGSPSTLQARYCRQSISIDPNEEGIWIIPSFEPEREKSTPAGGEEEDITREGDQPGGGGIIPPGDITTPPDGGEKRIKRFKITGAVPVDSYGELFRCFVGPAVRMDLQKLRLGVQFEMETLAGKELDLNDPALKSMKEAARQLGMAFDTED